MNKNIVVFSQQVAGFLMLNGFVLKKIETANKKSDRRRNVFIFNESQEIRNKINSFDQFKSNFEKEAMK